MYEFLDYQVQDVMSRAVCIRGETTLAEAEALLEKHGWNGVPVVDEAERPIGFFTSLDLLKAFAFGEDTILPPYERVLAGPVSSVMSLDVISVCPRTPLTRLLQKLVDTRHKSVAVVDGDRVVGVVAREDVMGALRRAAQGKRPGAA
jgi:CBS domain-containing protein